MYSSTLWVSPDTKAQMMCLFLTYLTQMCNPFRRVQFSSSNHDRYKYSPTTPKPHYGDGASHEEELRKLKAGHDPLEAHVKCPQGDEHFTHILPERTQGESPPQHTINTQDDPCLSHIHCATERTIHRRPFVDCIMETDITLGWKPLNLERYDRTIDPDEHLDAFLTQVNLYTNDDAILCCVFPSSLKWVTLT